MLIMDYLENEKTHFNLLSKEEFFYTYDNWPLFTKNTSYSYVIYPIKSAFDESKFHCVSHQGNRGRIHFLYSDEIHVGYMFEVLKSDLLIKTRNSFLSASKAINWDYFKDIKVDTFLSNNYLSVYLYGEEAISASSKKLLVPVILP